MIFQVWELRILCLTHINLAERVVHVHVLVFILTMTVHVLPSSLVLSVTTELLGPSPALVNADTWNSYPVNFPSPVIVVERTVPS